MEIAENAVTPKSGAGNGRKNGNQDMEEGSSYQNNSNMHLLESLAVSCKKKNNKTAKQVNFFDCQDTLRALSVEVFSAYIGRFHNKLRHFANVGNKMQGHCTKNEVFH